MVEQQRAGTSLRDLQEGATGVVVGYADGRQATRRFIEMGLVPGARVTRLRAAPLGDPVEYAVYGARLAVRNCDAAELLIEIEG